MTLLLEKKLLTTEKVPTSDEVSNVPRILQQVSRLLKALIRFKNVLRILQQMRRLIKVPKNWKI